MATFIESIDGGRRLSVDHTRGEPLTIVVEFTGAEAIAAVTDRDWSAEIRTTVDSEVIEATFEKMSEETATLPGAVEVRAITFTSEDAADLEAGEYVFDLQRDSGPSSPRTYFPASSLTIEGDVTRGGGS